MKRCNLITLVAAAISLAAAQMALAQEPSAGQDLLPVFARAQQGKPLRYVAIGGSITQAGEGWIGSWLREQFPKSDITVINSGMSATGSSLGIFRIERDIIVHQPDLVAIEYCVNDGGLIDEDAIRFNESLVVRLKSLPKPPAIIFIEAASQGGVNLQRHRKVARHYGLLEADTQSAVDAELKKLDKPWSELFGDAVHPNKAGHAFYSKVISGCLEPYVKLAREKTPVEEPVKLPKPLSQKPLILDGQLVPLVGMRTPGWNVEGNSKDWWVRFFQGTLTAKDPCATLQFHFRGTMVALFYNMQTDQGTFYASVDGQQPRHIFTNSRGGYSSDIIAKDLTPGEHELTVVLPPVSPPAATAINGPVKLGYLMIAGSTSSPANTAIPMGPYTADVLKQLVFKPIAAADWSWTGPFSLSDSSARDSLVDIHRTFEPENKTATVQWHSVPAGDKPWVDMRKLTASDKPAIIYAKTTITSEKDGQALLALAADYYAVAWLNGKVVATFDGPHGGAQSQVFFPVTLQAGANEILIKVGAGSAGFGYSAAIGKIPAITE